MDTRGLIRYGGDFWPEPIVRARGSYLETASGRRVLDFTAGQICATIGHNHPRVSDAIRRALDDVIHLNSWMLSPPVFELVQALLATLPQSLARAIFLSTGGESIEVAARFTDYTGPFMIHCHMLNHEDHGMMARFRVVDPRRLAGHARGTAVRARQLPHAVDPMRTLAATSRADLGGVAHRSGIALGVELGLALLVLAGVRFSRAGSVTR